MAKAPMQHCVHPGLQTSHSPLRRAVSARGRIDNLHQLLVAGWKRDTHGKSIAQLREEKTSTSYWLALLRGA